MNPVTQFEDLILAYAEDIKKRRQLTYAAEAKVSEERVQQQADTCSLKDSDLIYAAYDRCPCGAGLAYAKGIGARGYWDCSDILTGRAAAKGEEGAKTHTDKMPFVFWSVKSEQQPSANGATTRPKPASEPGPAAASVLEKLKTRAAQDRAERCKRGEHKYAYGGPSHNDPIYVCEYCGKID